MGLHQIVYSSQLSPEAFQSDQPIDIQLEKILEPARIRNRELNITGLLIYNAGNFVQVLEGQQVVIQKLFEKIAADPRHTNVRRLASREIRERMFAKWFMGLLNLDDHLEIDRSLFDNFIAVANSRVSSETISKCLLETLKEFKNQLDSLEFFAAK